MSSPPFAERRFEDHGEWRKGRQLTDRWRLRKQLARLADDGDHAGIVLDALKDKGLERPALHSRKKSPYAYYQRIGLSEN